MSQLGEDDLDLLEQSSKPTATLNATKWGVHKLIRSLDAEDKFDM